MEHTKLLWEVITDDDDGDLLIYYRETDTMVAMIPYIGSEYAARDKANADFIIRACNHHDALVDMLKKHTHIKRCENPRREKLGKVDLHGSGYKIETDMLHPCGKCDVCEADALLKQIRGE